MASSAAAGWAPPSADDVASLSVLVSKVVAAGRLNRHALHAELAGRAAQRAATLYPDDSLVTASLRRLEIAALVGTAVVGSEAERPALLCRALALLQPVNETLLARLHTLLPGQCWEEEIAHDAHAQGVMSNPPKPLAVRQRNAQMMGYGLLLDCVFNNFNMLLSKLGTHAQDEQMHAFVLAALSIIPDTVNMVGMVPE